MVTKSLVVERMIWISPSKSLSNMPGRTWIPWRVELALPNMRPNVWGGKGPYIPTGSVRGLFWVVSIVSVVVQRSSPALPAVARQRSVT